VVQGQRRPGLTGRDTSLHRARDPHRARSARELALKARLALASPQLLDPRQRGFAIETIQAVIDAAEVLELRAVANRARALFENRGRPRLMLVDVTLTHPATDCPASRPDEALALVASPGADEEVAVKLRAVLWSAACMLLAQPDQVAFAIVEADSADSAQTFVGSPRQLRSGDSIELGDSMLVGSIEPNSAES